MKFWMKSWSGLFFFLSLLFLCLSSPAVLAAEKKVIVSWGYNGIHPDGRVETVRPSQKMLDQCQIKNTSRKAFLQQTKVSRDRYSKALDKYSNVNLITLQQLQCVLAFDKSRSQNGILRAKKSLKNLIRRILQSGQVDSVSGISLQSLITKIESVNVSAFTWGQLLDKNAFRGSGVNILSANTVVLGNGYWRRLQFAEYGPTFLLHEILGAIGVDDGEYQVSSAIWWMSKNPKRVRRILKSLQRASQAAKTSLGRQLAGSGTATVVGSGGDPSELFVKLSLLNSIPNLLAAYHRPGTDRRLKALTASDLERHFFKLKVRATVLNFTGYLYRVSELYTLELFPELNFGDNVAVVPFHLVHTNQIPELIKILSDIVNTMVPRLAIDKAEGRL